MEKRSDHSIGVRVCGRAWRPQEKISPLEGTTRHGVGGRKGCAGGGGRQDERSSGASVGWGWDRDRRRPRHRRLMFSPGTSVKLAKSWEPGRGTTLTEGVQLGGSGGKKKKDRGRVIRSASFLKKKQNRAQNSGFLLPDFCVYCFTELFLCADLHPCHPLAPRGRGPRDAACWGPRVSGHSRVQSKLHSDKHQSAPPPLLARVCPARLASPRAAARGLVLASEKSFVSFILGGVEGMGEK